MKSSICAAARLLVAGCLFFGQVASAQRPGSAVTGNAGQLGRSIPLGQHPRLPAAEVQGLEVNLGQAAPFPRTHAASSKPKPQKSAPPPATPVTQNPARGAESAQPQDSEKELVGESTIRERLDSASQVAPVSWRRDFESIERRPVETATFGKGPRHIVVVGSLSGNSEAAHALIDRFAEVLSRHSIVPVQFSILVVRCPNPDGAADRVLTNSRGVDLNRNFPSTRFTAVPRPQTGDKPGSEPETRALIQLMNQFQPDLVIHVVEARSSRGTVRSDDFVPRDLLPRYDSAPYDHVYKAGSLAGYVHETLKRSIIELELPANSSTETEEDSLLQLLVATLDQSTRSLRAQLQTRESVAQQESRPATTRETGQVRPDGLRGIVEFLPPPPDAPPEVVKPRYIELPAPPGE